MKKIISAILTMFLLIQSFAFADAIMYNPILDPLPFASELEPVVLVVIPLTILVGIIMIIKLIVNKDRRKNLFKIITWLLIILSFIGLIIRANNRYDSELKSHNMGRIDHMEIQANNSAFLPFVGQSVSGVNVKELFARVERYNNNEEIRDVFREVEIVGDVTSADEINMKKRYSVAIEEYNSYGAVSKIRITEQ